MSWRWLPVVALVACGRTGPELPSELRTPKEEGTPSAPPVDEVFGVPSCETPIAACGELPFELPKAYRCDLAAPDLRGVSVFAVATRSGLYLIRGSEPEPVLVHRFSLVEDENTSFGTPRVLVRGDWIAAALPRQPLVGGEFLVELVIADGSGRVAYVDVFHSDNTGGQYDLFGNDRGLFILSMSWRAGPIHHIVHPTGAQTVGGEFEVVADPGPDGWALVDDSSEPSSAGYDWFDLLGSRRGPSCYRERSTYAPVKVFSPGIAYVARESSELIYEHAFERCRIGLSDLAQGAYETLGTNRQGWVHLGWHDAGLNVVTANVVTGSRMMGYALEPVPGLVFPDEDAWTLHPRKGLVDFAGATVTTTERTDAEGATYYQLHRTFDGASWEAIGNGLLLHPSTANERAIEEVGGTYLLGAYWLTETGGGRYMTHVVRPGSGVVRDVHAAYGTIVVSEDGRCVGTIRDGGKVETVDTETGETHEGPSVDVDDARLAAYGFVSVKAE
jgi:hypothetical protein